jgi:hypothetical protein
MFLPTQERKNAKKKTLVGTQPHKQNRDSKLKMKPVG